MGDCRRRTARASGSETAARDVRARAACAPQRRFQRSRRWPRSLDTLTVDAFGRLLRAGELSSRHVTDACLATHRRRQRPSERVHARHGGRGAGAGAGRRPRARRRNRPRPAPRCAGLDQGPDRRARHADDRGVPCSRGSRRRTGRDRHRAAAARRRRVRRQDQPARVRVRHHQRGVGLRDHPQPARRDPLVWWFERRVRNQRRRRVWRSRASAPTPVARSAFPPPPAASSA